MSYSTGVASGTHFGYPESFGKAHVTYCDGNIIQLEFPNGSVENRAYDDEGGVTRVMISPFRKNIEIVRD